MTAPTMTEIKPTLGQPEFREAYDPREFDDTLPVDPAWAGWDFSVGSNLTFSSNPTDGFYVHLGLSDDAIRDQRVYRSVTREQVLAFAEHLLRLVDAKPVLTLSEVV
jgi:hypothetical protein